MADWYAGGAKCLEKPPPLPVHAICVETGTQQNVSIRERAHCTR